MCLKKVTLITTDKDVTVYKYLIVRPNLDPMSDEKLYKSPIYYQYWSVGMTHTVDLFQRKEVEGSNLGDVVVYGGFFHSFAAVGDTVYAAAKYYAQNKQYKDEVVVGEFTIPKGYKVFTGKVNQTTADGYASETLRFERVMTELDEEIKRLAEYVPV